MTSKYQDDYDLVKAQLNQRLDDIRLKFNQHMAAVSDFVRKDMQRPHDDETDVIHASNAAQQRIANLGYDVMILMRDTHKASVNYHKAKARYGKRKG